MKTLIAKKVGMTQIFDEESNAKGVPHKDILLVRLCICHNVV